MIIFGSNAKHLKSVQSPSETCPSCGTKGSLAFSVFSKHFHVFWIPIFPIGKKGYAQCLHCKHAMEVKEMSGSVKRGYDQVKSETRAPIWQFSGLGILAILITWLSIQDVRNTELDLEYIASPLEGDVYRYKTENNHYSTLRVIGVTLDSVYVSPNEYETDRVASVYKLDLETNYSDFHYAISRPEIEMMFSEGTIYDVDRK